MRALFAAIRQWWFAWTGQTPPYETQLIESDPPDSMHPKVIYLVTEDGLAWHASLICPCGCGATLHMNLLPDERPCWRVIEHWHGLVSLHPSVWRTKGCRAHFWFNRGRIHWCARTENVSPPPDRQWTA